MKIAISAETTVDLTKDLIERFEIKIVPFGILLGNDLKLDGEVSSDEIIAFVDKTGVLPKTSAVNAVQYKEHFESLLKDYDAVIHFSLSSELSSACANAKSVANELENVFVVDTKSLSTGIALLAIYAKKLVDKGLPANEIYEKCLKRVPYVQASFVLKRLDYLYKGGRCGALAYFGANLLKIRPQIIVKEGKMVSGKKYRGVYDKVVDCYCKDTLEQFNIPDLEEAFITYTTADEETLKKAKSHLINAGFKHIHFTRAGGTITSHCGENCLGILYINDGNEGH